jgi:hypothetical protein
MRESGPTGKLGVERLRLVSVIKTAVMIHMVRIPRNSQKKTNYGDIRNTVQGFFG